MARPLTMMPAPSWRKTGRFVSSQVMSKPMRSAASPAAPLSRHSRCPHRWRRHGVGVQTEAPAAEGLDHLEGKRPERHVHAVGAELAVRPHRGVPAAMVHDGEGLGGAEVGVEGQADDDEELAHRVLAGEPHPLVGLGVGRPHHAHRVGRVVDEELVEARERGVLARGRVGGGHEAPVPTEERSSSVRAVVDCLLLQLRVRRIVRRRGSPVGSGSGGRSRARSRRCTVRSPHGGRPAHRG